MVFLDTDVMVDVLRGHPPAVAWLKGLGDEEIVLSGLVAMELIQGCRDRGQQRAVEEQLKAFRVLWPSEDACNRALATFTRTHLAQGVGVLDALIAHHALSAGVPLHTFNRKHYAPITGLEVVEPYAR